MIFRSRAMAAPETLGERLRQLREESKMSIDDVARNIGVAAKYITAIETCRYKDLPGVVYARNFIRLYARLMDMNPQTAVERFAQEYQILTAARPSRRPLMVERSRESKPWIRRHARLVIAIVACAAAAGIFSWQAVRLIIPPPLTVTAPAGDTSTNANTIVVEGRTEIGAAVSINNQPVDVSLHGTFTVPIDVQPGLNTLKIMAKKKFSQPRTVIRQVLVKQ